MDQYKEGTQRQQICLIISSLLHMVLFYNELQSVSNLSQLIMQWTCHNLPCLNEASNVIRQPDPGLGGCGYQATNCLVCMPIQTVALVFKGGSSQFPMYMPLKEADPISSSSLRKDSPMTDLRLLHGAGG